jgi:hypothetical protein
MLTLKNSITISLVTRLVSLHCVFSRLLPICIAIYLTSCEHQQRPIIIEGRVVLYKLGDGIVVLHHIDHDDNYQPLANVTIQCYEDEQERIELSEIKATTNNDGNFELVFKPETVAKLSRKLVYVTLKFDNRIFYRYPLSLAVQRGVALKV